MAAPAGAQCIRDQAGAVGHRRMFLTLLELLDFPATMFSHFVCVCVYVCRGPIAVLLRLTPMGQARVEAARATRSNRVGPCPGRLPKCWDRLGRPGKARCRFVCGMCRSRLPSTASSFLPELLHWLVSVGVTMAVCRQPQASSLTTCSRMHSRRKLRCMHRMDTRHASKLCASALASLTLHRLPAASNRGHA